MEGDNGTDRRDRHGSRRVDERVHHHALDGAEDRTAPKGQTAEGSGLCRLRQHDRQTITYPHLDASSADRL